MKDAVSTRDHEAPAHEAEGRKSHECGDSPIPVRTVSRDVDVGPLGVVEDIGVCVQRIVRSLGDARHLD